MRRRRIKALLNYKFVATKYKKDPLSEYEKLFKQWEERQKKIRKAIHVLTLENEYHKMLKDEISKQKRE